MSIFSGWPVGAHKAKSEVWTLPSSVKGRSADIVSDRLRYARRSTDWYRKKKRVRQSVSKFGRLVAIISLTLGGIAPLVSSIYESVHPLVGYVLLAIGGFVLLADRVFGFSSGWMRFMLAATKIESATEIYRIRAIGLLMEKPGVNDEAVIKISEMFTAEVSSIIIDETAAWTEEFNLGRDEISALGIQSQTAGKL
ncbi:SLATT domain-containing protein [Pseudomonas sp. ODNR1LW]|nr:SLATT domain-containing protein [Pseudomonas sp. ODNR1LW]